MAKALEMTECEVVARKASRNQIRKQALTSTFQSHHAVE